MWLFFMGIAVIYRFDSYSSQLLNLNSTGGEYMSNYKAALTLSLLVLLMFASYVAFANGYLDPIIDRMGDGFSEMVDNVFSGMPK
jgi:hypothetical protein